MTQEKTPTLEQLYAELKAVMGKTPINDGEVMRLTKAIQKHSSDITKAALELAKKEAESLAGDREKLAIEIHKAIAGQFNAKLEAVKAKGFTFKLDEPDLQYKSVALTVPTIRKSTGGGGGTGETVQSQTGMRRGELIKKFATQGEKDKVQAAFDNAASNPGSAKWSAEKPVVKRILADHPELIKK